MVAFVRLSVLNDENLYSRKLPILLTGDAFTETGVARSVSRRPSHVDRYAIAIRRVFDRQPAVIRVPSQGRTARQLFERHRESVNTPSESEGHQRQQSGELAETSRRRPGRGRVALVPEGRFLQKVGRRHYTNLMGHVQRECRTTSSVGTRNNISPTHPASIKVTSSWRNYRIWFFFFYDITSNIRRDQFF